MGKLSVTLEKFLEGDFKRNQLIADFCGVSYETALDWTKKREPRGEPLNKLWHFLDAHGLRVAQTESLNPGVYYLGKLIAFGVLTPEEAMNLLGLDGPSMYIWRVLQGKIVPSSIRKGAVTETTLTERYGETMRKAQKEKHDLGLVPPPSGSAVPSNDGSYITVAAAFISGLVPLLTRINEEGEASVKALRAALDDDTFYEVLDGLKAMSGRRAYQFYYGKEKADDPQTSD